jgi:uncharacterized protein with GYD domain
LESAGRIAEDEESDMAHYLIEFGYTAQSWSTQVETQANVVDRISPALDACGAKIECLYYAFGDSDLVGIIDFKTPEDAAAFALTVTASGALRSYKTTPLLTVDQGIASMKRAADMRTHYKAPTTVSLVEQAPAKT